MAEGGGGRSRVWRTGWAGPLLWATLFAGCYAGAFGLRFDGRWIDPHAEFFLRTVGWTALLKTLVFSSFGLHRVGRRRVARHDLAALGQACMASALLMVLGAYLFFPRYNLPRGVLLLDLLLTAAVVAGLWGAARMAWDRRKPLSIDDLLGREPAQLDVQDITQWLSGKTLMVTGSAGSIGGELCRQLLAFSPGKLVLVDRSELGQFECEREFQALAPGQPMEVCLADVADQRRMRRLFQEHRPDVVFHAAAYKHVPLMERNPSEAVRCNVLGTRILADLAEDFGASSFVLVSTDKAVHPTSVMGACKRAAECYVQAVAQQAVCRFVTVRFGNVLGSSGSVAPIFHQQIQAGGPVTVTDPRMERFFMTIPEAAQLVVQAGVMGRGGEIFVLDMGPPVKIDDLARDMIRMSGLEVGRDVPIVYTGVRPGEKLSEQLSLPDERRQPTRHPKIVVLDRPAVDAEAVEQRLADLEASLDLEDQAVVSALARMAPEYVPQGVWRGAESCEETVRQRRHPTARAA